MNHKIIERLRMIDFLLDQFGSFNRSHLMDYWGLSKPQITSDIQAYINECPKNIRYDMSTKAYVKTDNFKRKWP